MEYQPENVCASHQWRGYGECPVCEGEMDGEEIVYVTYSEALPNREHGIVNQKQQSEAIRDLTEPGWRERKREHLEKFKGVFTRPEDLPAKPGQLPKGGSHD